MDNWKESVFEAVKEAARVVVFALVSWGLAKLGSLPQTEVIMIGTIVLRMVDKFIHEWESTKAKGLVPF